MVKQNGFTLAEVLIAIALLGGVAAFAIPKVLQNTQESKKKAIFKEGVAQISSLYYEASLDGITESNFGPYFETHLNALKCVQSPMTCSPGNTAPAICNKWDCTMPNGANYMYSNHGLIDDFEIDYNGLTNPPNTYLEDRLYFWGNLKAATYCDIKTNTLGEIGNSSQPGCRYTTGAGWTTDEMNTYYRRMMGIQ